MFQVSRGNKAELESLDEREEFPSKYWYSVVKSLIYYIYSRKSTADCNIIS